MRDFLKKLNEFKEKDFKLLEETGDKAVSTKYRVLSNSRDRVGDPIFVPIDQSSKLLTLDSILPFSASEQVFFDSPEKQLKSRYIDNIKEDYDRLIAQYRQEDADFYDHQDIGQKSRLFTKMHISPPRYDFFPRTENLVLAPCDLTYEEKQVERDQSWSAETSTSMLRKPGNFKDFARGKMGNVPFHPGGQNVTEVVSENDSIEVNNRMDKYQSPEDIERSSIALLDQPLSDEQFEKLLVVAPGLDKSLNLTDLHAQLNVDSCSSVHDEEEVLESIGVNPESLLRPYKEVFKNENSLRNVESTIADEKYAAKKTGNDAANALQQLLDGDDDDELGLDFEEEESDDDQVVDENKVKAVLVNEVNLEESNEIISEDADEDSKTEVDKEIESLLSLGSQVQDGDIKSSETLCDSKLTVDYEYAITERVDVSDFQNKVKEMAKTYPFELDDFQKEAVLHIENHECVFVAAHTSAGKTVVAEYAIAMSQKHLTRTIYTSPIKALSNQKFRDFKKTFGDDVGLITGDVSIECEASCLVMTTEILRSMLYRGADLIRDLEWVIFDEIHYINDCERGVVWEEVIIMLPDHVGLIFLSATTPNTYEFSDWIGRMKQKKIHVITTYKRPVPLLHCLYTHGTMIPIMESNKPFQRTKHSQAVAVLEQHTSKKKAVTYKSNNNNQSGRGGGEKHDWMKLLKLLEKEELLPVVIFSFSKRLCDECAGRLSSLSLTSKTEQTEIHYFVTTSVKKLNGSDQELPQVLRLKEMLVRGIGVHHGGLLPILKEIVEMLFARGLVKVLFSTETFAMGVNMPARTVVYNGIRKHDGKNFRYLLPGEYTQMAGRAGRRGLDTVGTVLIACFSDIPDVLALHTMLEGKASALESQFRLTYNMILNLLRVEDMTVEDMIKRSFSEFRTQKALSMKNIPSLLRRLTKLLNKLEKVSYIDTDSLAKYNISKEELETYMHIQNEVLYWESKMVECISTSTNSKSAFVPGRALLVHLKGSPEPCLSLILQRNSSSENNLITSLLILTISSKPFNMAKLINTNTVVSSRDAFDRFSKKNKKCLQNGSHGELLGKHYLVIEVPIASVRSLYTQKTKVFPSIFDCNYESSLAKLIDYLSELNSVQRIDPKKDLKMMDINMADIMSELNQCETILSQSKCTEIPQFVGILERMQKLTKVKRHIDKLKYALSNDSLSLFPDFQQRLNVLKKLDYINKIDKTVQLKGRVACEINTCDELLLTEIIFENTFENLEPEEIVSLLSALVFQEKNQDEPVLTNRLTIAKENVTEIVESIALLQIEEHVEINLKEYIKQLNFGLMEVVYEWARGMPFKQICDLTSVAEGSIVRCITRLDEVCREVRNAARVIGDPGLFRKMEIASESIKRDVVFATSLYLS